MYSRGKPGIIVSDHGTEFTSNAILAWSKDHKIRGCSVAALYNHFRPHSSIGYQTPVAYAATIAATASNAAQDEGYAFPPVAITAPIGLSKTAEALIAAG